MRCHVVGMLALNWRWYTGLLCVGVDWETFSLTQFDDVVRCVGGRVVERICRLLARDLDVCSHGLPSVSSLVLGRGQGMQCNPMQYSLVYL